VSQHFVADGKRSADFQRHTTVAHWLVCRTYFVYSYSCNKTGREVLFSASVTVFSRWSRCNHILCFSKWVNMQNDCGGELYHFNFHSCNWRHGINNNNTVYKEEEENSMALLPWFSCKQPLQHAYEQRANLGTNFPWMYRDRERERNNKKKRCLVGIISRCVVQTRWVF
jgi:hypothetical protein